MLSGRVWAGFSGPIGVPGLGWGKHEFTESSAQRPDIFIARWGGLGRKMWPDSWAGPGLGSKKLSRAFSQSGPTRPGLK
jgi:hypothetical protein